MLHSQSRRLHVDVGVVLDELLRVAGSAQY